MRSARTAPRWPFRVMRALRPTAHDRAMTGTEILNLAVDAAAYDAVVVLWRTERGIQPVLLPRTLGRSPVAQRPDPSLDRRRRRAPAMVRRSLRGSGSR